MYCGINVENLIKLGIIPSNIKEIAINSFLKEIKNLISTHETITIGEMRLIVSWSKEYLEQMTTEKLLCLSAADMPYCLRNIITDQIFQPISNADYLFNEIIISNPTFHYDEYYEEVEYIYNTLAECCGITSCNEDYDWYDLFKVYQKPQQFHEKIALYMLKLKMKS